MLQNAKTTKDTHDMSVYRLSDASFIEVRKAVNNNVYKKLFSVPGLPAHV